MRPDPSQLDQDPAFFRALIARIGRGKLWVSERVGISHRRLNYLSVGTRIVDGEIKKVSMSYPEQFIIESLVDDERDA